jgi:PPE-repeat protein
VVFANRAQLAALVATNILGQNTPAIAANEAMYGEFWAQDATAMSTYAANAAMAAQVTPLTEPTQNTNPGGSAAQSAAVSNAASGAGTNASLHGLLGGLQSTATSAAVPAASAAAAPTTRMGALQQFFGIGAVVDTVNTVNVTGSWFLFIGMSAIPLLSHFVAGAPFGFTMGDATPLGAGLGFGTTLASAESGIGGATLAGMGSAANVGGMSVPAGWSAAAPAGAAETTLAGTGWTASVDEAATGVGGGGMNGVMPGMAAAGGKGGMGIGGPRYGVKPKVMPKQVFV